MTNKYFSRTYWLAWGLVVLATWLTYSDKISGEGWITLALGVMGMWQARRYADNRLRTENGGTNDMGNDCAEIPEG